ncbi:MAG: reverse transcriptase-like protein [Bacillales bacterium]|nr:reverse transcriptase-like protein [Bacillales bacterium]
MKMKIKWLYSQKKIQDIWFESEWMETKKILPLIQDLEKTGRLKQVVVIDEMENQWSKKDYMKLNEKLEEEPTDITVYFDGGFDRTTFTAGIGIVIYYTKSGVPYRIRANQKLDELESNNEAEYAALYQAVQMLEELGVKNTVCTISGDSLGVLKQLSGEWPCFEENLNKWLDRIEGKINELKIMPLYKEVDRKQNKEADKLASQALKGIIINSHSKL